MFPQFLNIVKKKKNNSNKRDFLPIAIIDAEFELSSGNRYFYVQKFFFCFSDYCKKHGICISERKISNIASNI